MKFSTLALASPIVLMSMINTTLGAAVAQPKDAAGYDNDPRSVNVTGLPYPVVDAVYSGEIDGHAFEVSGSYEKALTQLSAKYPGINLNNTGVNASYTPHGAAGGKLAERGGKILPPWCFPRPDNQWPVTLWDGAEWAARDVLGRAGTTRIEGKSCVRMFCGEFLYHNTRQWATAIYACNDNAYRIDPNTHYLGTYVADTIWTKACYRKEPFGGPWYTKGQMFDTDGYNVVIRGLSKFRGSRANCGETF